MKGLSLSSLRYLLSSGLTRGGSGEGDGECASRSGVDNFSSFVERERGRRVRSVVSSSSSSSNERFVNGISSSGSGWKDMATGNSTESQSANSGGSEGIALFG